MKTDWIDELEAAHKAATPGAWRHHKAKTWDHVKCGQDYILQNGFERDVREAVIAHNNAPRILRALRAAEAASGAFRLWHRAETEDAALSARMIEAMAKLRKALGGEPDAG